LAILGQALSYLLAASWQQLFGHDKHREHFLSIGSCFERCSNPPTSPGPVRSAQVKRAAFNCRKVKEY